MASGASTAMRPVKRREGENRRSDVMAGTERTAVAVLKSLLALAPAKQLWKEMRCDILGA